MAWNRLHALGTRRGRGHLLRAEGSYATPNRSAPFTVRKQSAMALLLGMTRCGRVRFDGTSGWWALKTTGPLGPWARRGRMEYSKVDAGSAALYNAAVSVVPESNMPAFPCCSKILVNQKVLLADADEGCKLWVFQLHRTNIIASAAALSRGASLKSKLCLYIPAKQLGTVLPQTVIYDTLRLRGISYPDHNGDCLSVASNLVGRSAPTV